MFLLLLVVSVLLVVCVLPVILELLVGSFRIILTFSFFRKLFLFQGASYSYSELPYQVGSPSPLKLRKSSQERAFSGEKIGLLLLFAKQKGIFIGFADAPPLPFYNIIPNLVASIFWGSFFWDGRF